MQELHPFIVIWLVLNNGGYKYLGDILLSVIDTYQRCLDAVINFLTLETVVYV